MKEAIKIKTSNVVVEFFEKIMVAKREKNKEINRKMKSGEIRIAE